MDLDDNSDDSDGSYLINLQELVVTPSTTKTTTTKPPIVESSAADDNSDNDVKMDPSSSSPPRQGFLTTTSNQPTTPTRRGITTPSFTAVDDIYSIDEDELAELQKLMGPGPITEDPATLWSLSEYHIDYWPSVADSVRVTDMIEHICLYEKDSSKKHGDRYRYVWDI